MGDAIEAGFETVPQFLYAEAALLENRCYEEWVGLFVPDGRYRVPSHPAGDGDPQLANNIVYDDVPRLRERIVRMGGGSFWAQDPPSRTSRLVSNVVLVERARDRCVVDSRFITVEVRRDVANVFAGRNRHVLQWSERGWQIREKVVYLVQSDLPHENLTFLI